MKYDKLNREELLDLIEKLEEELYNNNYDLEKNKIKNNKLELLITDIIYSTKQIISDNKDNKRFNNEEINFEECINNLIEYIQKYCKDNNLYL